MGTFTDVEEGWAAVRACANKEVSRAVEGVLDVSSVATVEAEIGGRPRRRVDAGGAGCAAETGKADGTSKSGTCSAVAEAAMFQRYI